MHHEVPLNANPDALPVNAEILYKKSLIKKYRNSEKAKEVYLHRIRSDVGEKCVVLVHSSRSNGMSATSARLRRLVTIASFSSAFLCTGAEILFQLHNNVSNILPEVRAVRGQFFMGCSSITLQPRIYYICIYFMCPEGKSEPMILTGTTS